MVTPFLLVISRNWGTYPKVSGNGTVRHRTIRRCRLHDLVGGFQQLLRRHRRVGRGQRLSHRRSRHRNVDAVAPTNARMAKGTPAAATVVELGGGDVIVTAGRNIDAGIYYVERGAGTFRLVGI